MANFYDWHKTLTYDSDVTMVVGPRGIGKTFGLRKQCIKDYINNKWRMVEICRYKTELSDVSENYFEKLAQLDDFKDYVFKSDKKYMYIAKKETQSEGKKKKINWEIMGYFVALSEEQRKKKKTFFNVRRIIFDEAILDKKDRYHRYLPNEYAKIANLVDTVSRERSDTKGIKPRVYFLANALDLVNPIFIANGVGFNIQYGYRWYKSKTFLLHYVKDDTYSIEKQNNTVAGRMLLGTIDGEIASNNVFDIINNEFVMDKPKNARFTFGIVLNKQTFGIWDDVNSGFYFVTGKVPKNTDRPIYSLTLADNSINYVAAKKADSVLKNFADFYYCGLLRYSNVKIKNNFIEVLSFFGIK